VARARGREGEEYLRKILQAFETRSDQLNPVWLRYEVSEFESKKWREERARVRKNVREQKGDLSDLRWKVKVDYARKGDKVRASMSDDLPASVGGGRTRLEAYNGEIRVTTISDDNRYEISRKPGRISVYGSPWELTGEEAFHHIVLRNWAAGKLQLTVTPVAEEHPEGGEDTLVLGIVYPDTGARNKIWFLPASGFSIRRFEVYNKQNQLLQRSLTEEFETVAGISIPKRGNVTHYSYGKVGKKREFEVESVVLKRGDIPDSLFDVEIPKDAVIYDSDLQVLVRDPKQAQAHLDEVLSKIQRDKYPWRVWVISGSVLVGLLFVASVLWGRRRRKNARLVGIPRT